MLTDTAKFGGHSLKELGVVHGWPCIQNLVASIYDRVIVLTGVMASGIRQVMPGRGWFRQIFFNERGYVALFIASHRGHAKVVSRLMGLGIDACRKMPSGRSAIHVAVFKRRVTCVNLLVGRLSVLP